MPRMIGRIELKIISEETSVEDVRTLLQAIRDWEQARGMDSFIGVDAPEMTNEETAWVFNNLTPPLSRQIFIPRKGKG